MCRVLLEKLTGSQLVKKFPAFHGTRMFITALTSVRHLSLSCASPIQSTHPHPTSCRSIIILSTLASEFYIPKFRIYLSYLYRRIGYLPAYEDGTGCSGTAAYKIQTQVFFPQESVHRPENGPLKGRNMSLREAMKE